MFGGDRLGVDVSEFPEALPVCLLVVPAGGEGGGGGGIFPALVTCLARVRITGLWSLPPSCSLTSLLAIFWMLSVAMAISDVLVVFHTLE